MTKLDTLDSDFIPDVLEWKRKIQERVYQKTRGMTSDEFLEYARKRSVEIREERRLRRAELAVENQT
jgi:hypothetical protein